MTSKDHTEQAGSDDSLGPEAFAALAGAERLTEGAVIAVALSGGPDSMALAWLLSRQAARAGATVHALTVDHGLRPEAAEEARQVGQWVKVWPALRHAILTLDMKGKNGEVPSSLMETARDRRYEALAGYCRRQGIQSLFLAHHLDDQAETFLFRLAKGSGLDGLAAMRTAQPYDDNLTLFRPLLAVPKARLVDLCRAEDIPFVADPTNEDTRFARNRLRAARAALEAEGLTPKRLGVTAARIGRARAALDFYARDIFTRALAVQDKDSVHLDFVLVAEQPAEIRLRVLLLAMQDLRPGDYNPRMESVESLAEAIFDTARPFKRRSLGGLLVGHSRKDNLILIDREEV